MRTPRPHVPDKRSALLGAARKVFNEKGYRGTTIAAIAGEAGVATGSFYSYFNSKASCFLGLVDAFYERLMGAVMTRREAEPSTEKKLLASMDAAVQTFLDEPELAHLVIGNLHGGQPIVRQRLEAIAHELARLLAADLFELMPPGSEGAWALALFLMGGLERVLDTHLAGPLADPEQLREALQAACRGIIAAAREKGPPQ